jgi:membrane-bound lytic murein transglycosylase B
MQDSKDNSWARDYSADGNEDLSANDRDAGAPAGNHAHADGWQQYRHWISKAPVPRGRRSGVDPSLYTWKGYRNWTEQVKRNWSDS